MIGLGVGGVIGWLRPDWGNAVYFLRDIFINLIKSIIAPLVFSTIVVGIAGAGALRKVGRMGIKALIYFEIVTTAALVIGLAVVNFTKPGSGVTLAATNTDVLKTIGQAHPQTFVETLVHVFPASVIEQNAYTPTIASQIPIKIPTVREMRILVLASILEVGSRCAANPLEPHSQTITRYRPET